MSTSAFDFPNQRLLGRTAASIFESSAEREQFCGCFFDSCPAAEQQTAAIWLHEDPTAGAVAWSSLYARVINSTEREALREQHDRGELYFFDPSSLFCVSAIQAIAPLSERCVLDLCSSPGGKGIYAWRHFSRPTLITNEVSQGRLPALISNLKRCRISPAAVATRPANFFASITPASFGAVLVDAPCSGQSLLLKGVKNPGCFHPVTIGRNASRQKQILIQAAKCVAPGGYLTYMTCTFSPQENEEVLEWFLKRSPEFESVAVAHLATYQSALTSHCCYRLFPWQGGAGGFTALLRNQSAGEVLVVPELQYCWQSELTSEVLYPLKSL